jgi:hypothetical protein
MDLVPTPQTKPISRMFSEDEMRRYFAPFPRQSLPFFVIGGLLFLGGLFSLSLPGSAGLILSVIGLIVLSIGGIIVYATIGGSKPTDREYDQWVADQGQALVPHALRKLGLDVSQIQGVPLRIRGLVLPGTKEGEGFEGAEARVKRGRDGKWRCSVNTFLYFLPAPDRLTAYEGIVSAMNQISRRDRTYEYYYADVVGATTADVQDRITLNNIQYRFRLQRFSLRINNGDSIGATVFGAPLSDNAPIFSMPDPGLETTMANLRLALRGKK